MTIIFDQENTRNYRKQKFAWKKYLETKGYPNEIVMWTLKGPHEYYALKNQKNDDITTFAVNIIGHEYEKIMRDFKLWIIKLLKENNEEVFKNWTESEIIPEDVWKNFKFNNWHGKVTGRIKAWYDGCELSPEGLKIKQIVNLHFRDYVTIKYVNGTIEHLWANEHWSLPGYSSSLEEYMGDITVEGLQWFIQSNINEKEKMKLANWLVSNIFCILGI